VPLPHFRGALDAAVGREASRRGGPGATAGPAGTAPCGVAGRARELSQKPEVRKMLAGSNVPPDRYARMHSFETCVVDLMLQIQGLRQTLGRAAAPRRAPGW